MTPARGLILVLVLAAVGVGIWRFTSDDGVEKPKLGPDISAPVTDLKPTGNALDGYRWDHHNGGEFVVWRLVDKVSVSDTPRSGLAIHFSCAAKSPPDKDNLISKPGRFAGHDVIWLSQPPAEKKGDDDKPAKDKGNNATVDEDDEEEKPAGVQLRQDAFLDFKHAAAAEPLKVHVWIWADTQLHLAELEKLAKALSFAPTRKK